MKYKITIQVRVIDGQTDAVLRPTSSWTSENTFLSNSFRDLSFEGLTLTQIQTQLLKHYEKDLNLLAQINLCSHITREILAENTDFHDLVGKDWAVVGSLVSLELNHS